MKDYAPVAQLDRVLGFEPRCRGFESLRARHIYQRLSSDLCHKNQATVAKTGSVAKIITDAKHRHSGRAYAAGSSLFSDSMKSTVLPSLSTARYKYTHWLFTLI